MKWLRLIVIMAIWLIIGTAVGFAVYYMLPKRYISEAEVALNSEMLSLEGLAKFQRLSLAESVDREIVSQLFKTDQALNHAAQKLGVKGVSAVKDDVKVVTEEGSPVVMIKASGSTPEKAKILAGALVEKAIDLDTSRRAERALNAISAVKARQQEVERELDVLNGSIQQFNSERGVTLSSDTERQQTASLTIADCEQKLATHYIEEASLKNRLHQTDGLIEMFASKGILPSGFEFEDPEKSYTLADARRNLLDKESELASLGSRYGQQHPKVLSAHAEVDATRKSVMALLNTQRERLNTRLMDTAQAIKILQGKINSTESQAKQMDLTLDPKYSNMLGQREALRLSFAQLAQRLSELGVYANAKTSSFHLFSTPTTPDKPSLVQLITALAIGGIGGFLLGACHCLMAAMKMKAT